MDSSSLFGVLAGLLAVLVILAALRWWWLTSRERNELRRRVDRLLYEQGRLMSEKPAKALPEVESRSAGEREHAEGDIPEVLPELVDACVARDCVLFVGAGLGVSAGFPTRRQLLSRMLERLESEDPDGGWERLGELLREWELSMVEELLQTRLSRERLLSLAREASRGRGGAELPEVFKILREIPFRGVVSSAWDDLLERAFGRRKGRRLVARGSADFPQILRSEEFFVLKLYGDLSDDASLIFTAEEYRQAVSENRGYARFVGSLFSSETLLFMGASLDTVEEFLTNSEIRGRVASRGNTEETSSPSTQRLHFALVPREVGTQLMQERLAAKFNLRLLTYEPTPGFPEVGRFAEALKRAVEAAVGDRERVPVKAETLNEIILENIGPFEHLQLKLNANWNILLGDNGCGKSTILRAIALALGGDDRTDGAAQDLLRKGQSTGSIELRIGKDTSYRQDTYRTVLTFDGHRVNVAPDEYTPVQAGRWLVLGFPPLRGASSLAIRGPSSSRRRSANPVVDDLLPLLDDAVDTRFDDLKQWLINTAVAAKGRSKVAARNRQLLESVLGSRDGEVRGILQKLTPGVAFRYAGYQEDPWEVLIETEDKIGMPIGLISQGMSSVFAWVGTLLQRLYEVYPESEHPEREECLVLIDELDAHLHPEWQSEIVGLLREIFPKLQVIATTHSPLVIADTEEGETFFLKRSEGRVDLVQIQKSFKGYRADQILTDPVFGMSYARGGETKRKLETYKRLVTKDEDELTHEETKTLERVSKELEDDLPSRQELAETRKASELMRRWMTEQLEHIPDSERERVLDEAALYLTKIRSRD